MAKLTENLPYKNRTRRQHVAAAIDTMMSKLLYYDRKGDDDLPGRAIEAALLSGEVTVDEILEVVKETLQTGMRGLQADQPYGCWGVQETCQCRCGPCTRTDEPRTHCRNADRAHG